MNDIDDFSHLLLKVGKLTETIEHLRDGNYLRASSELALQLSIQLYYAGLLNEGRRIFELAEPLELLSGRVIDSNSLPRELKDLLCAWIHAALLFRNCEEILDVIRRIRVKPDRAYAEYKNEEEFSLDLQKWLLFQGIMACCERSNQEEWNILFDTLTKHTDRKILFFTLLRSAERCQEKEEIDWAKSLLDQLLNRFQPQELNTFVENNQITKVRFDLAELIIKISDDKALAQLWIEGIAPIPLQDRSMEFATYKLQFRYGRLLYLLGETHEPEFLRDEAETVTDFLSHVNEKEKQNYRVIALAVFNLARLQAWAYSNFYIEPTSFIREVKWILDLIGPKYWELVRHSSLEFRQSRSWFLNIIIDTAALHGELVTKELANNLELRWTNEREKKLWSVDLQRNAYQGSIVSLLGEALKAEKPPLQEIMHTIKNLVLPFMTGEESNFIEPLIVKTRGCLGSETALDYASQIVSRIRIDMLSSYRSSWHRAVAKGVKTIGFTPAKVGLKPEDLEESNKTYESKDLDRKLYLKNGECLEPDAVLSRISSIDDLRTLIEEEDRENSHYFRWENAVENLSQKLVSSTQLRKLESIVKSKFSSSSSGRYTLAKILLTISKKAKSLGDSSFAWKIAEEALRTTEATGWDSYFDGGTRYGVLKHLIAIDSEQGRKIANKLYAEEASQVQISSYRTSHNLDQILEVLFDEIPVTKIWGVIEDYLDELFAGVPLEPELPSQIQEALQLDTGEEDTPARAIADFLSLHLDHFSDPVAQGGVRVFTFSLLEEKIAVVPALIEALNRTEQSAERALMVLDAASEYNPKSIEPLEEILKQLRGSPNFLIRLIASCVWARYKNEELLLQTVEREIPTVYSFELPSISLHRTEEVAGRENITRALIEDPARKLRPLDIEARKIANIARIAESNVFYQAKYYFQKLESKRTWFSEERELTEEKISRFLHDIGLEHYFQKPHISIARQALSYVAADLFDAGYITINSLRRLWRVLVYHDSDFIVNYPSHRPSCIPTIGGIPVNDSTFISLPDDWIESAKTSLPLLDLRFDDKQIILGEWTRLRYLHDRSPVEERISFIRATDPENLWHEFKVERGHRPFSQFVKCQTAFLKLAFTARKNKSTDQSTRFEL